MAHERYAVVRTADNVVTNVVEYDANAAAWTPPAGHVAVLDVAHEAEIGGTYDGVAFHPRVAPAPTPAELAFIADKEDVRDFVDDVDVDAFLAAANGSATNAQRDVIIKRTIRAVRSLARATRYAVRELATDD